MHHHAPVQSKRGEQYPSSDTILKLDVCRCGATREMLFTFSEKDKDFTFTSSTGWRKDA